MGIKAECEIRLLRKSRLRPHKDVCTVILGFTAQTHRGLARESSVCPENVADGTLHPPRPRKSSLRNKLSTRLFKRKPRLAVRIGEGCAPCATPPVFPLAERHDLLTDCHCVVRQTSALGKDCREH